jgi:hypothetical protein
MRVVHLYLLAYFALLLGAALALWQAGILWRIPGVWLGVAALVAAGSGILLAVASSPPARTGS